MSRDLVGQLIAQIDAHELPAPVREWRFHATRKWRFDLAWPDRLLALEVDGGIWVRGRHSQGVGFLRDCEKLNESIILGWRVLRVATNHIRNGDAVAWVRRALEGK